MKYLVSIIVSAPFVFGAAPTPIAMADDLNLSPEQVRKLERIDATVDQVQRYSQAKRLEVLTPDQRKLYFSRYKCDTN